MPTLAPADAQIYLDALTRAVVALAVALLAWWARRWAERAEETRDTVIRIETQFTGGGADGIGGMRAEMTDLKVGVKEASRKVDEVSAALREQNQQTHNELGKIGLWRERTDDRLQAIEEHPALADAPKRRTIRRRTEDR